MGLNLKLIDSGWDQEIRQATALGRTALRVICPFIKEATVRRLLLGSQVTEIEVITRFDLGEMADGFNDIAALQLLLNYGAKVRGIRNLHAKLYLFGRRRAIVTSANLTEAALLRNREFGFVSDDKRVLNRCHEYFDTLWGNAGPDLTLSRIREWEDRIDDARIIGFHPPEVACLPDEGVAWKVEPTLAEGSIEKTHDTQAFVKLFGEDSSRATLDLKVLDEVRESGSHWALTYPKNKKPRLVKSGAKMFMGRLVSGDIIIYGRAVGMRHEEGRDEASNDEMLRRPFKRRWTNYIRVHHCEFVSGRLRNGVSLNKLIEKFNSSSFASTQRNASVGSGNTDPRKALCRQPQVQLSGVATEWMDRNLDRVIEKHGRLTSAELGSLDWPKPLPMSLRGYNHWLRRVEKLKRSSARDYCRFLVRCSENVSERICNKSVPDESSAFRFLNRVMNVAKSGRSHGAFNRGFITKSLRPALRAYGRFNQAMAVKSRA